MAKYLINTARTLIFSTALPPPAVAAAMAALELLREQPRRVEKLQRNAQVLREALGESGLPVPAGETPIVPLIVGDAARDGRRQRARARARDLRPGDPAADRARGHLAAAAGGDGLAHEVGAARGRRRRSPRPRGRRRAPDARAAGADGGRARVFDGLATPPSAGVRGRFVVRRPPPGRGGSGMRAARGRGSRGCWAVRRWRLALMRS